jgi:hypothetical protein
MTIVQKLKLRFWILSAILVAGIITAIFYPNVLDKELYLSKGHYMTVIEQFILIPISWFWIDKKLLYIRSHLIISLLLCLIFLITIVATNHPYLATLPLSSVIGRWIANKHLDPIRKIDMETVDETEDYSEYHIKMLIYFVITLPISGIIYFLINLLFDL